MLPITYSPVTLLGLAAIASCFYNKVIRDRFTCLFKICTIFFYFFRSLSERVISRFVAVSK